MMVAMHPARITARWLRAERDADGRWVRREVALRSDGMVLGRIADPISATWTGPTPATEWAAVQPWRAGPDLLSALLQHAGYSRID